VWPTLALVGGAAALFTQGSVWLPQETMDAPLGGDNVLKLLQDILTVASFSFIVWTALDMVRPTLPQRVERAQTLRRLFVLGLFLVVLIATFTQTTDRGPTDYFFVEHQQGKVPVFVFATSYILEMIALAAALLWGVRGRRAKQYWWFRGGCMAVVAACTFELVDLLTSQVPVLAPFRGVGRALFDPLFYPGVVAIVGSIVAFTLAPRIREFAIRKRRRPLDHIASRHNLPDAKRADLDGLLDLTVTIRNAHIAHTVQLTAEELGSLNAAEDFVERRAGRSVQLGNRKITRISPGAIG
jgi:hypothetical protein